MARRGHGLFTAIARSAARAQREAHIARRRQLAEVERERRSAARSAAACEKQARELDREQRGAAALLDREQRSAARSAAALEKQGRELYLRKRQEDVAELNQQLVVRVGAVKTLLEASLSGAGAASFESLRVQESPPRFKGPPEPKAPGPLPDPPGFLARLLDGAGRRYQAALAGQQAHDAAHQRWERRLKRLRTEHEATMRAFSLKKQQRDHEVDELIRAYREADREAVVAYSSMVLEQSEYPDGFPQTFRVAYAPESRQLVVDYELPSPAIIPSVVEYSFVKSRDQIIEKARKPSEVKELYQQIVAGVALRTAHEVIQADQGNYIDMVTFSGFVEVVDPATGRDTRPCLVSVRVTKQRFLELDLARVDKRACLRNLGAHVSPRPEEMQPVRPIIEFDMVDRRFVDQADIISGLDARPNLIDLSPTEFEQLVSNLFQRMGLETRVTRPSRDGGVDTVAYDARPIVGGKVVIQAKRYSNTVGVSAVRDLYGTMLNEGASKGILVATSSYGSASYEFAKDKPIELIDGGGLLYLLEENGFPARIIFPDESHPVGSQESGPT